VEYKDMKILVLIVMLLSSIFISTKATASCQATANATKSILSLTKLPAEIRADLMTLANNQMSDRGGKLLISDAPDATERDYPLTRFYQAHLISGQWYVQFEVSQFSGVRTLAYFRNGVSTYQRSGAVNLGGPPCESITAALAGVYAAKGP
jgi:hypothetical protein